jgi:transketolase C-terminal domain/subunit
VPSCSTFGAFMTSRAKDQARVNDINESNVKMVATHCGLSVGESIRKTGRVVSVHDHETHTGLAAYVRKTLVDLELDTPMKALGVNEYQLSGTSDELYELAGLAVSDIVSAVKSLL